LFLNPSVPDWIVVNANAGLLLSRCDGKTSVGEIALSYGIDASKVEALVSKAVAHGVLEGCPAAAEHCDDCACDKHRIVTEPPRLRTVHWKLTDDCNLRCRYCYAESGGASPRMPLTELSRVAREVAVISSSVEHVLSGGEPLLHPEALEFGELLNSMGNSISLLTNGTLVNASNAQRIANFSDRIKISLDGSTEAIHAITRGRGNYAAVVAAIDMLAALGAKVQVAMTVHKQNLGDIEAMTRRYGSMLTFQPLFPAGRGARRDDLHLTGSEYYEALGATEGVAPMAAIGSVLERLRGRGVTRCALADAEISISENGDVFPCQLLTDADFAAGNVREEPLAARGVSVNTLAKCRDCPIRLLCAGACRARDYHEIGTIEEVGDFCEYEQQAFINGLFDSQWTCARNRRFAIRPRSLRQAR
jgi:radical SAM protein with 4Fe4S-binding SPASM domain